MSTKRPISVALVISVTLLVLGTTSREARAGVYPGNKCVSDKMKAAGKKCKSLLKAWSSWDRDQVTTSRDDDLAAAALKFGESWSAADAKALTKGVDCADTTLSAPDMEALIDAAILSIKDGINTGLNLANADDAKCGADLLKAASKKCDKLLKAESTLVKKVAKAGARDDRDAAESAASTAFSAAWTNATTGGCPTTATETAIENLIDELTGDVVENTTVSPNVADDTFTTITPGGGIEYEKRTLDPICSDSSAYHFFVKRGSENKLLMYYQGGGACWDFLTCGLIGTFDPTVNVNGSDNPNNKTCAGGANAGTACSTGSECPGGSCGAGLADQENPDNPFKDWNIVFVPYCTGDVHWGDAENSYNGGGLGFAHIEHRGYVNAKVAEKWAREHFVNPDEVFVTGSSAGAYGALLHGTLLHLVYPASDINVLADAGNGVITQDFQQNKFPVWKVDQNLPTYIPGLDQPISSLTLVDLTEAVANFYPETNWAHYTTAYDGGTGGQTGFYNVMLNPTTNPLTAAALWPRWWDASCAWNTAMRAQAAATAAALPNNYRYYIGTGSRHTMFGSNKVYTDTTGGVPTIVDWINAMRNHDTPNWTNVEATDEGLLLPGDPAPDPLEAPFGTSGPNTVITCP